ncbi:helix-turn-helix domain-containing protein [Paenibacillus guangzhouensis]|uniref:helix-turn-helix domain-containing protein n=1 Tax=Paenibacillus guangzhouensis TaxID=1473112 RepID=UPI001266B437|nr:helix-turn-helix domain-containing protein [Paenibacillus guangzhouensis]
MRLSISGKVMMIYGSIFIIIIIITFSLSYFGTVGRLQTDLKDTHIALLKQIDDKIELVFHSTEKDLLNLSEELEYVYFMYDSFDDVSQKYVNFFGLSNKLKTMVHANDQFSSVFVYSNISGDVLTDKAFIKKNESEDHWLSGYLDMAGYTKWIATHKVWDGEKMQDVVTLIRPYPLISSPGYRKGLVAVNINEDMLYRMISDVFAGNQEGMHTFIIDDKGNIVTHDDKSQLYKNMTDIPYINRILGSKGSGQFAVEWNGGKQSIFYTKSNYTGWRIVSVIPETQLYQPLESIRNLMIGIVVLMVVLALSVLFYVNRRTFRPLDRLVSKMTGAFKPMKPGQVARLDYLETVFDQMFMDREQLEQRVRDSKPILKWRIVMDMLAGYRTEYSSVSRQLEFTGFPLHPSMFVVCTAEIEKEGSMNSKDETLYTYVLCNVAEELIHMETAGVAIDLGSGRSAIIFSFAEGDVEQNHLQALTILELILDVMKHQFGLRVSAGVGRCYSDMKDIPTSFDQSQKALHYRMVLGSHAVISFEDLIGSDNQDYYRLIKMTERIMEALRHTEIEKIRKNVALLYQEAIGDGLSPELIRHLSYELVMKSLQAIAATGIDTDEVLNSMGNLHERMNRCHDWKVLEQIVLEALTQIASKVEEKREQRGSNKLIENMLIYIEEHYRESEFSLAQLADQFELTPTYISKLFKEHTEKNFIDYLIETRVKAAVALLMDKNRKINDIAEEVGYNNTRSFLRAFKKYTGMTPSEHRDWVLGANTEIAVE